MQTTVSTDWLAQHIDDKTTKIIDASWHLPTEQRDAALEYKQSHIAGAQFFDIDAISDQTSALPHMMPSADQFAASVGAMGISNSDTVVVYDASGVFSAARVWWMFRSFGHKNVLVLNGGLSAWQSAGHPVTSVTVSPEAKTYSATLDADQIVAAEQILPSGKQILDARAPARFHGEAPEPRAGLRSGHIPGAQCLFFKSLLTPDNRLKPKAELEMVFQDAGVDLAKPIITSCGSGVTAAVIVMALTELGVTDVALYDGSWTEWGSREDLPIETGV